jgi:lysophospholipase L1-like esterase
MVENYSFLAIGDSYTIGEGVPLQKSFPYQTTQFLRRKGVNFFAPEIIAKTGWTTDELQIAMEDYSFLDSYDFVTLLIGVNNQYRAYPVEAYEKEFSILLSQAVAFANKNPEHVYVLSIPDYSVTSFGRNLANNKIAYEIDRYNELNQRISHLIGVHYIDVTQSSREAANDTSLVAADGLHPSGKEYEKWASILSDAINDQLKADIFN